MNAPAGEQMPHPLEPSPSKIIAVHVNYRSRARERGRMPGEPSYFLKPPSSLAGTGDPLVRPDGCELLSFEGEIALVLGERARRVPRERAWEYVRWVTAANDAGVYDLRYADRGSNLRSKGADGFTPVGPRLLAARDLDPSALRLRSWVNGELAQDAPAEDLLFGFDYLIADLSRLITLEPGDVIVTGTPAGTRVVGPGDVVEVEVSDTTTGGATTGRLSSPVVAADESLEPPGALPRTDEDARAAAGEPTAPTLTEETRAALRSVSTATLSVQLRKRGIDHATIAGVRPLGSGGTMVGTARTLRYLPLREDLFQRYGTGMNAQKRTIDAINPGEVLVIDARGDAGAGTVGDLLALRAQTRGAAGIVTDGAARDTTALGGLDIPVYCGGGHPTVLGRRHVPWEADVSVACGGALVEPGDVLVGDADGVVVVPPRLAEEVAADAVEQERQEGFVAEHIAAGEAVDGLYPMGPGWRAVYEDWRARQDRG